MNVVEFFKQNCKDQSINPHPNLWEKVEAKIELSQNASSHKAVEMSKKIGNTSLAKTKWSIPKVFAIAAVTVAAVATTVFIIYRTNESAVNSNALAMSQTVSASSGNANKPLESAAGIIDTDKQLDKSKTEGQELSNMPSQQNLQHTNTTSISANNSQTQTTSSATKSFATAQQTKGNAQKVSTSQLVDQTVKQEASDLGPAFLSTSQSAAKVRNKISKVEEQEVASASTSEIASIGNVAISPLVIPNTITANNDGVNDTWVINGLENYTSHYIKITDKDGNKVFESKNYKNNWNGKSLPAGNYFYTITLLKDGKQTIKNGLLTIAH